MIRRLSLPVEHEAVFARLGTSRRPLGMLTTRPTFQLLRETYFDTNDGALRDQKMTLCLRAEARGLQTLELSVTGRVNLQGVVEVTSLETPVVDGGLYATLRGASEVATRLREVVDPDALRPRVAVDVDREAREMRRGWFGRPSHRVTFDDMVAHAPGVTRTFQELTLTELSQGPVQLETLAGRLAADHGIEADGLDTYGRVSSWFEGPEGAPRLDTTPDVRLALLLMRRGEVALVESERGLVPPSTRGSGEDLALEYLREIRGSEAGDTPELDLVGFAPVGRGISDVEVWLHEHIPAGELSEGFVWIPLMELLLRVGGPRLRAPALIATLSLLVRSEIGHRLQREAPIDRGAPRLLPVPPDRPEGIAPGALPEDLLDLELSILDFNQRVLELAEDPSIPLLERFRFLAIFSSNLDEFFVVRVGRLKDEVARGAEDAEGDLSPARLLDVTAIRVRALVSRQYACLRQMLLPELATRGVRIRPWSELRPDQRADLTQRFSNEIFPLLTPLSLSSGPGRPFPRLVSLGLAVAAVLRKTGEDRSELGYVPVPDDLPRVLPVSGTSDLIPVEDVIIANASQLFASSEVQAGYVFRASRMADVEIDEDSSGSLLAAIADEVEARPFKPVIRLEVQSSMPREVRAYLLKELRAEQSGEGAKLTRADIYELDGALDLTGLSELAEIDLEDGVYESYEPSRPLEEGASIFERLREGDLVFHHPFVAFDNTVGRFLTEAAADPDVVSIKLTLYRTGRDSPIMEALLRALEAGKDVSVFVELKARFDEQSNIEWTHRLRAAGANVVYGVVGYKTHAKTALVVRREDGAVRRYVHIGTGNYNAATAKFYTDLGLMSADPDLGADLNDFFNELTGSAGPPEKRYRRLLVAPNSLVQELERMVLREVEHARAGRPARIQAKLNGLADRKIVQALYEAAAEGVQIDLIVRSICTLRPGVPGLSERIRVRSILGRFLEHSRIYYFENAGQGEYFIGSADWRARNLRKRVEVVAPIDDATGRVLLRSILDAQLSDPRAWELRADGVFERLTGSGPTSQEDMMATAGEGVPLSG